MYGISDFTRNYKFLGFIIILKIFIENKNFILYISILINEK